MFASSLVEPVGRVPSGDLLAELPQDAADLDVDESRTRRWRDEPGAAHGAAAGDAFAGPPGDNKPAVAHLVGSDDARAGLPEHDAPDAAALADADDAVGVLERWAWFEDPRADDWWVGDALEDAAACLPGAGEAPAAAAAEVRAVRPAGAGGGRVVELAGECGGRVVELVGASGGRATDLTRPCDDDAPVGRWPWPWASAEVLEQAPPGSGLARLLELADPGSLDDASLVEGVAAWERLAAWAHLGAALSAGELSRRSSMNPRWSAPAPAKECVAGDELAMRLGWSRPAAGRLVRDGRALAAQLIPVADAVRAGLVDTPKLRVLTDRLHDRADQLSWPVLEQVLPEAPLRTPTQLAADVDRALLAADAEDAAVRLPKALATRHVCHPRRLPDGMAGLWAVLPADDAARVDATLEATARAARAVGDPRTLDQLRADVLAGLGTGDALLAGAARAASGGDGAGTPVAGGALVQDAAAVVTGDTPRQRGALPEVGTALLDGAEDEAAAGSEDPGGGRPPGRRAPGIRIPTVRVDVTVALSTLMGLDELPGEVAGLGPIPAEQARALAAGGLWRRLVTDPLTGAVLDVGRRRYRPPAGLTEHVMARDGSCVAPGCCVPSHRCDLDHTTEFHGAPANGSPVPGTTSAANLGPLSERCHRLKTDGGFVLRQVQPGVFEWQTPAGMAYRVTPGRNGRTEKLPGRRSGYPEVPPF